jgi:transmembrane sensor
MTEIDSIIQKYLQGKSSEDENQQLNQWMQQSPDNKKRLLAEKDIWDTYAFHSNLKKYETQPELEILKKRLAPARLSRTINLNEILKIAAILLVTFGLGWASQYIPFAGHEQTAEVTMQEIFVPKGQVNQVFLADGTRVWINSETKLTIPSIFENGKRVVKLSGEAFFEVAKDKKRPFRVEVNGQQIEVLGTSFNVRAYDNSNEIETTLETGQIQLHIGNQTTLLNPGEQSLFNKSEKQLFISKVNPVTFSSWKDGRFEFQNEDLIEVFKVIERWYDVEITADEGYFRGMRFSGVIKRNKDARHFLELLNLTVPIRYEIKADKISISAKK